jgi:hypothetical protein
MVPTALKFQESETRPAGVEVVAQAKVALASRQLSTNTFTDQVPAVPG